MIFSDVKEFKEYFDQSYHKDVRMVVTSGGFDPVHIGHLRCIQESAKITSKIANEKSPYTAKLVVIVNGDGFLTRKKGRPFMTHAERMEIIDGLRGVDYVVGWDDGSQTVEGAIEELEPDIFTKGGDRTDASNVPEWEVCARLGCEIRFGVGGGKIQSSSNLIGSTETSDLDAVNIVDAGIDERWRMKDARVVDKPWGYEEIIVENEKYVGKILTIDKGHQLSRQYHEVKDETIFVISGTLALEIGQGDSIETVFMEQGESRRILPGTVHRFKHWLGRVKLLEISTSELDDVVRLEDDYSRA